MDFQTHIIILRSSYLWAYPCLPLTEPEPESIPGEVYVCECVGGRKQASG